MKGHSHDPVSGVERFLHAVSMVDVYVDVQHPLVVPGRRAARSNVHVLIQSIIEWIHLAILKNKTKTTNGQFHGPLQNQENIHSLFTASFFFYLIPLRSSRW